jgi:hypothetical protein
MDYIHYEKYDNDIIGIFRRINITSLAIGWGPRILTKIVISSKVPTFLYIIAPQKWTIPTVELFFLVAGQSILLGRQNRNRSAQQVACSQSWTWFNLKAAARPQPAKVGPSCEICHGCHGCWCAHVSNWIFKGKMRGFLKVGFPCSWSDLSRFDPRTIATSVPMSDTLQSNRFW